jgi:2-phospho-L-lactate/phosphoenolpyruvate guanylyltransferase
VIPAVVPFKTLDATKSRLRPAFGETTGRLTLAMLGDVLETLLRVPELARVAVLTPDAEVAAAARAAGAEARVRDDRGLNPALDAAAAELTGAEALLIVLGDVPGARAEEISALLAAAPERGLALAASRDGGTAALVRVPPDVVPGGFGPDSARRHRELAEGAGVAFRRLDLPSLAIDVDAAADLRALLASDAPAPRTRALLRELRWEVA